MVHTFAPEIVQFGKGLALVITLLVAGGEQVGGFGNNIVFKLSHRLELQTCTLFKSLRRPAKRCERGALKGIGLAVKEAAQEAKRGNLTERVHERGAVARNHIQIAAARLHKGWEQAGAVHTLAFRENGLQIFQAVDREIQRLHTAVLRRVHKVHHTDAVLFHKIDNIFFGKVLGSFFEPRHHLVGAQFQILLHIKF